MDQEDAQEVLANLQVVTRERSEVISLISNPFQERGLSAAAAFTARFRASQATGQKKAARTALVPEMSDKMSHGRRLGYGL